MDRKAEKMIEKVAETIVISGLNYIASKLTSKESEKNNSNNKKKHYNNYKRQAINK